MATGQPQLGLETVRREPQLGERAPDGLDQPQRDLLPNTLLVKLGGSRARTATSTRPNGSPALDTVWVRPVTVFLMVSVTS